MAITLANKKAKKANIISLCQHYHAENIRVFGSVARCESTDNSDVDFLVSFLPNASLFDKAGLIEDLSRLFERKVDVVSERAVIPHLQKTMNSEALPL